MNSNNSVDNINGNVFYSTRKLLLFWFSVVLLCGATFFSAPVQAQDSIPFKRTPFNLFLSRSDHFDSSYIENHTYGFMLRLYAIDKFSDLKYSLDDYPSFRISPNRRTNVGFGFNYLWLGLNFAFNLPLINNDDLKYGETARMDAQMYIYGRKNILDFYLTYYKGFYLENPQDYVPEWDSESPYPNFPNMKQLTLGGAYTYIFNSERFSYKAAFIQNDIQKRSAGSFLLGSVLSYYHMKSDKATIIASGYDTLFPDLPIFNDTLLFKRFEYYSVGIRAGYAYSFVVKKYFFASLSAEPSLSFGATVERQKDNDLERSSKLVTGFMGRFAVGYNGPSYFAVFSYLFDSEDLADRDIAINYALGYWRVSVGVRLNWFQKKCRVVQTQMDR